MEINAGRPRISYWLAAIILLGMGQALAWAQIPPGTLLWKADVAGIQQQSCPAMSPDGNTLYVAGSGLTALTTSGAVLWTFPVNNWVVESPSVADDGTIYCVDQSSRFYAINPDGTQKWSYDLQIEGIYGGNFHSTLAIAADGTVFCANSGILLAFGPDGTRKWAFPFFGTSAYYDSPVIGADGTIYLSTASGLTAVNPEATIKWTYSTSYWTPESIAIGPDGTLYVNGSTLRAFRPDGNLIWEADCGSHDPPVLGTDGTIYFGINGALWSVSATGTIVWRNLVGFNVWHYNGKTTAAVDADGNVYYYGSNSVFAVSQTGNVLWTCSGPLAGVGPIQIFTGRTARFTPPLAMDSTPFRARASPWGPRVGPCTVRISATPAKWSDRRSNRWPAGGTEILISRSKASPISRSPCFTPPTSPIGAFLPTGRFPPPARRSPTSRRRTPPCGFIGSLPRKPVALSHLSLVFASSQYGSQVLPSSANSSALNFIDLPSAAMLADERVW